MLYLNNIWWRHGLTHFLRWWLFVPGIQWSPAQRPVMQGWIAPFHFLFLFLYFKYILQGKPFSYTVLPWCAVVIILTKLWKTMEWPLKWDTLTLTGCHDNEIGRQAINSFHNNILASWYKYSGRKGKCLTRLHHYQMFQTFKRIMFIYTSQLIFFHDVRLRMPWWRHQIETFSALLEICAGNSPVTGEFPAQRRVTRSFDVFYDLCLNKRFSKQMMRLVIRDAISPIMTSL